MEFMTGLITLLRYQSQKMVTPKLSLGGSKTSQTQTREITTVQQQHKVGHAGLHWTTVDERKQMLISIKSCYKCGADFKPVPQTKPAAFHKCKWCTAEKQYARCNGQVGIDPCGLGGKFVHVMPVRQCLLHQAQQRLLRQAQQAFYQPGGWKFACKHEQSEWEAVTIAHTPPSSTILLGRSPNWRARRAPREGWAAGPSSVPRQLGFWPITSLLHTYRGINKCFIIWLPMFVLNSWSCLLQKTEKKTTLESDLNFFLPYPVSIYPNVLPCWFSPDETA